MKKAMSVFTLTFTTIILLSFNVQAVPIEILGKDINTTRELHIPDIPNSISAQNEFLSYIEGYIVEDFESFSNEGKSVQPTDLKIDFGVAGTATLKGGYVSGTWDTVAINNGRFSTDETGDKFLEVRTGEDGNWDEASFTLEFEQAQSAFGFFGTDFENSGTKFTFETADGRTTIFDIPFNDPNGSAFFFGVIDTENPFIKVTFDGLNNAADWYGFDDFTIAIKEQVAIPTPEPATLILLVSGLAGLAGFRRKQRKK